MGYELYWIGKNDKDKIKVIKAEDNIMAIAKGIKLAKKLNLEVFSIIKNEILFTEELLK